MPDHRGEFILLQTLKPVEAGEVYSKIPPHATVLSWFTIQRALIDDLTPLLDKLVADYGDDSRVGVGRQRVLFGLNEDIPACEIDVDVQKIHDEVMDWVDDNDGHFKYEEFARELRSHVTDEPGMSIQPGNEITFSSLALLSARQTKTRKVNPVEYAASLENYL
jgi:hypothetical protein